MRPFAPVSLRPGQAALLASVTSHGRKPFSPQTAFTGSLLPAPTNPGDIAASPGFGWSHNSSFKPTPHRGVNSVLYATLHAVAAPLRVGLTPALGGRKAFCKCAAHRLDSPASAGASFRKRLSARCHFVQVCKARSHSSCVTFTGFGIFVFFREASGLHILSLLTGPAQSSRGALMLSRFGFRQVRQGFNFFGIPRA